jgi:hypothetical protein
MFWNGCVLEHDGPEGPPPEPSDTQGAGVLHTINTRTLIICNVFLSDRL